MLATSLFAYISLEGCIFDVMAGGVVPRVIEEHGKDFEDLRVQLLPLEGIHEIEMSQTIWKQNGALLCACWTIPSHGLVIRSQEFRIYSLNTTSRSPSVTYTLTSISKTTHVTMPK